MEDFPIKIRPTDLPDWSENFALAGFDPAAGIDVFLHLGRWRKDVSLWRQLVILSLPDNTFIVSRAVGKGLETERGPGAANLSMEVVEDGSHLRWRFLGAARRFSGEFLRHSLPIDGPLERLEFELDFQSDLPLWDLGHSGTATGFAGHGHTEQIGKTRAEIKFGSEVFNVDTYANRDHSRGPRTMRDSMIRHIWFHGIFDNGVRFYAYQVHDTDDVTPVLSEAAVVVDGVMHSAKLNVERPLPQRDALTHIFEPVPFSLEYAGGRIAGVAQSFPTSSYQQYTAPSESYIGARQIGLSPSRRLMEQSVLYALSDGTKGYGHMERTVPGTLLRDEDFLE
ncbi:MAG: hypothetical protein ABWZ40_06085 [Caulobacterales bacterium]